MNLKRRLHLLLAGVMIAAVLAACGDNTPTTAPATTAAPTTAAATTAAATTAAATTAAATTASAATTAAATTAAATTAAATTAAATTTTAAATSGGLSDLIETVKFDGTSGKKGGTFVYSFAGQFPTKIQPYYVSQVVASTVWRQIYASLIGQSNNAKYYPYLVTDVPTTDNGGVKIGADGKTMDVTVKLKPGLKWSDGAPLTSKDLVYTWKWVTDPDQSGLIGTDIEQWKLVTGVETPNETTAVIKFKQVYGPYLSFLEGFIPLPEQVWGKIPLKDQNAAKSPETTKPSVVSGPMKVEDFAADRVTLVRNDNFAPVWGFNAYLDKVILVKTPDANGAIAGATKGDLDEAENLDDNLVDAASKVPNAKADIAQQFSYEFLQFNLTNPLLQDKAVRKALDLSIDRPALIKQFRTPKTQQLAVPLSPLSAFYDKSLQPSKYDPEAAKKLLDDAGYKPGSDGIRAKDGKKLAFNLSTTTATVRKQTSEVLMAYWKEIGIDIKLTTYATELFADWASDGILAKGKYDIAMFAFVTAVDPDGSYGNFHSSQIPTDENKGNGANYGRINSPTLDKALQDQRNVADFGKRKELWYAWQKEIYDNTLVSPLYTRVNNYVINNKVKNFKPNPTTATNLWNIVEVYVG